MSSIIPQNTLLEHRFNRRNQRLCFATPTPSETNDLEPFLRSSILTKKSGLQKENLRKNEFNGQCRGTHAVTILSMSVASVLLFEFFILFFVFKARSLNHFFLFLKILVFIFYDQNLCLKTLMFQFYDQNPFLIFFALNFLFTHAVCFFCNRVF